MERLPCTVLHQCSQSPIIGCFVKDHGIVQHHTNPVGEDVDNSNKILKGIGEPGPSKNDNKSPHNGNVD